MRVWVPYEDLVEQLPEPLRVDVYDGTGEPPPTADEVSLYVAPYTFEQGPLELIGQLPKLRVVQTLTAGYEHVLPYLPEGVALCNAGRLHDASTAELAVTLMLASLRGVPDFVRGQDAGQWRHERRRSLADRTVLIVGYGGIGSAVERRLDGFEVQVTRVARRERKGVAEFSALPELLPQADVVVICVPLTEQTRGIVDAEFLRLMPDGALLVNVARGGVVDTDALVAEVGAGRLTAALDVTDPEPLPAGHPLWTAPGVLLSPHVGGNSTAFEPRARELIRGQLERYARGERLLHKVVPAGVEPDLD
ncbi:2-hydroxyacid dehydrogenase [Natronosporangium hydrolyticum]|uniref:2-hydroxyacid dehydrogenase n=1 Tax=Natronosporangium hydrolyticum TaxID=2811111 RepID=A0A895YC91_9ACTN|nr:2-hydroxyacid dehydrogenase [Natronosporangium hydrolyticum]QSB15091.1 2-hydroxyacid dehydrogenase [Natronosporangium hydrolyticum]